MINQLGAAVPELLNLEIFKSFSKEKILALCKDGTVVTSDHRQVLYKSGETADFFGIVLGGAYKLSRSSMTGEDVIVHFSIAGDVLAAFIMAQAHPVYPVTATAIGPSRFLKLPRENYLKLWKQDSDLIFKIQNLLSLRMALLQDQKAMSKAPLAQKIASLLLILLERNKSTDDMRLPLPLTRKEIADMLGASVESVIRIMSYWSKHGYIQTNDAYIQIIKLDKIIELINKNSEE